MTTPAKPDIDVSIEHLDFPTTEIACEAYVGDCPRAAEFALRSHCAACGRVFAALYCTSCKDWMVRWLTVIQPKMVISCLDLGEIRTAIVLDSVTAL